MIYTIKGDRTLLYSTPLVEYIREKNLYNGENLIYTCKYTDGTFSITNPTLEYKNCSFVNGYPHFDIPLDVCLEEIKFFLDNKRMYENNFCIRYGDTHPHKPVPKLAQLRNLLVENSISSLISNNVTSYYGIGDISIKTLNDFIKKNNLDISSEMLFFQIVNNCLDGNLRPKILEYDKVALLKIKYFLEKMDLPVKNFLIESSLYTNQKLYQTLKTDERYRDELKDNGELKYSLQELMFIYSLVKGNNDVLINIIGSNQVDHILRVNNILQIENQNIDSRFLTYGICRNGDERNMDEWGILLDNFIIANNLNINNRLLTPTELLKIIVTIVSNDNILDFANLTKHLKGIRVFCDNIEKKGEFHQDDIRVNNDLIGKMSLVGYNLNRSIEMGNQSYFYQYLLTVINEYEQNKDKYYNMESIYYEFVDACFKRLGFGTLIKEKESKVLKK